jgi:ATP-dependent DNA helicase DinG
MSDNLIDKVFGTGGLIAKFHDNYEHRPGQIKMAEEIVRAFEEKRHLLVEAGTGTGKTLAYLVPAIAAALSTKKRVVISTGTKESARAVDGEGHSVPQNVLPKKFSAAYMKGRSNYACLYRISKAEHQPILEGLDEMDYFDDVRRWSQVSKVGDRRELTNLPEDISFWSRINARSEVCLGQKCPDFEPCFITRMRARAEDADIIIVNHHLFFADLSVRGNQYGRVIPDYSSVIFDEAHLIEDIAADYFGVQVSNFQIDELVRDADALPITDAVATRDLTKVAAKIIGLAEQFWIRFTQARFDGRYPLLQDVFTYRTRDGNNAATQLGEAHHFLDEALGSLVASIDRFADTIPEVESLARRAKQTRADLDFIVHQAEHNYVYWLERRGKGMFLVHRLSMCRSCCAASSSTRSRHAC